MFKFFSKIFRVKSSELEAKLSPTPDCKFGGVGEIEIETWSDGEIKVKVSLKHTSIPDGTRVEFICGGHNLAVVNTVNGYAKKYLKPVQDGFLSVNIGDEAEVRVEGCSLYRGQFRPD